MAVAAFRVPGSATLRSAPPEVGRVAPPDNGPIIGSRALWSAGTRAHVPVALPRNARERSSSLKARALYITGRYVPLPPGIFASGSAAARLDGQPRTRGLALASQHAHDRQRGSRQAHAARVDSVHLGAAVGAFSTEIFFERQAPLFVNEIQL